MAQQISWWRSEARRVIREVLKDNPDNPRKSVRAAYPFGERAHWPYKIWLEEIRRALPPKQKVSLKDLWKE